MAQYGDACNLFGAPGAESELRRKLDILRGHCEAVGRPYEAIQKTALYQLNVTRDGRDGSVTPQAAVAQLTAMADLGFDEIILSMPNVIEPGLFDLLGSDIVPQVAALPVAGR